MLINLVDHESNYGCGSSINNLLLSPGASFSRRMSEDRRDFIIQRGKQKEKLCLPFSFAVLLVMGYMPKVFYFDVFDRIGSF